MMHSVLKNLDLMMGYDFHDLMPPGSPTLTGKAPYYCVMPLMGLLLTSSYERTTLSIYGLTMQRGTDIGPFIPHLGLPNCLLPAILIGSSSKSYFGSNNYTVGGKPAALALLMWMNLNLNCDGPLKMPPAPTGLVSSFSTHVAGMTLGDIVAGFAHMAFDSLLQFAIGRMFNLPCFTNLTQAVYERLAFEPMISLFEKMGDGAIASYLFEHNFEEMVAKGFFQPLANTAIGMFLGTPMGLSAPINLFNAVDGLPVKPNDQRGGIDRAQDAIQHYLDSPSVETHNIPPASSPTSSMADGPDAGAPGSDLDAGAADLDGDPQSAVAGAPPASPDNQCVDPDATAWPVGSSTQPASSATDGPDGADR